MRFLAQVVSAAGLAALVLCPGGVRAQQATAPTAPPAATDAPTGQGFVAGRVQSPILTIESDRLFSDSAFGRRIAQEIEQERAEITAENDRITEELTREEQSLTDKRASTPPEEFQAMADAFDEKVQRLRREQDDKARAIGTRLEEARRRLLATAQPVIEEIMRDTGAALIVERRTVFISADVIDITDAAIERINAAIGEGPTEQP